MKKVLWISRHPLGQQEAAALSEIIGEAEVSWKEIDFPELPNAAASLIDEAAKGFDFVGGVWPSQVQAAFVRRMLVGGHPVKTEGVRGMFFVVSRKATAKDGTPRPFVFDHIEVINFD